VGLFFVCSAFDFAAVTSWPASFELKTQFDLSLAERRVSPP